jgi:hypothetical protein
MAQLTDLTPAQLVAQLPANSFFMGEEEQRDFIMRKDL